MLPPPLIAGALGLEPLRDVFPLEADVTAETDVRDAVERTALFANPAFWNGEPLGDFGGVEEPFHHGLVSRISRTSAACRSCRRTIRRSPRRSYHSTSAPTASTK